MAVDEHLSRHRCRGFHLCRLAAMLVAVAIVGCSPTPVDSRQANSQGSQQADSEGNEAGDNTDSGNHSSQSNNGDGSGQDEDRRPVFRLGGPSGGTPAGKGLSFGNQEVDTTSAPISETFENKRDVDLMIETTSPEQPFALSEDGCDGRRLKPGESCVIDFVFQPDRADEWSKAWSAVITYFCNESSSDSRCTRFAEDAQGAKEWLVLGGWTLGLVGTGIDGADSGENGGATPVPDPGEST